MRYEKDVNDKVGFLIRCVLFLACVEAPIAVSAAGPAATGTLEVSVDGGTLAFRLKGRLLLVYAFATNQFKPYVRELYTMRGENVLRDAPAVWMALIHGSRGLIYFVL